MQRFFHLKQALGLFLGDAHHGDTGPHRDDLGDLLFTNRGLLAAAFAVPAGLQFGDAVAQFDLAVAQFSRQFVLLLLNGLFFFAQDGL